LFIVQCQLPSNKCGIQELENHHFCSRHREGTMEYYAAVTKNEDNLYKLIKIYFKDILVSKNVYVQNMIN
jgi:hypothetical protein